METMKQITLNAQGVGDMVVYTSKHAIPSSSSSNVGHDIAITSGEDGVVYFVDTHTEQALFDTVVCDGTMPALAIVPEQTHLLVVSGDENELYSYKMPPHTFERDALLLRSPVAIRHVACSSKFIAVATEDTEIKVLLRGSSDQMFSISGHDHGIKSVSFDPTGTLLCSASEDGTVRVFKLQEETLSASQVALFKIQFADLRAEQVFCRCAWSPAGELVAVPVNQGMVELFDTKTWKSSGQLLLPVHKSKPSDLNVVCFSPNGKYLAGASLKQEVFIWSLETKQVLRSFKVDHQVGALQWAPTQNTLLAFNDGGKLGVVKEVIPSGLTPPHHQQQVGSLGSMGKSAIASASGASAAPAVVGNKKPTGTKTKTQLNALQFVDDEAAEDGHGGGSDDDDDGESDGEAEAEIVGVEAIKASFGFGSASASGEATSTQEADLGLAYEEEEEDDDLETLRRNAKAASSSSSVALPPFQEPFQSGAVSDGSVSLLAWTPLGEIECVRGASRQENLVKVEFADKSRRGFKFSDNYLFSMATFDNFGAFFAVPRRARQHFDDSEDEMIRSFIFYRPFESWASNSSWHLDLPDLEDATCIATSKDFCAVATSLNCLRIYSTSGIAYALLRLPGQVVTMVASPNGSQLAVVYYENGLFPILKCQILEIQVNCDLQRVKKISETIFPLSPPIVDVFASHKENENKKKDFTQYSTLQWLGFDERNILYSVDSHGVVQALAKAYDYASWFPIGCIFGNSTSEIPKVFPLGVVNNALLYFPIENGQKAPKLRGKHRPVPLKFNFQNALFPKNAKINGKQAKNAPPEANELWQHVRLAAIPEISGFESGNFAHFDEKRLQEQAEMDKSLILMMKSACTNDTPAKVLDLAKCLHLEKSHQIAQKLAVHFGFRTLQTQLYDLYRDRFERPQEQDIYRAPAARSARQYEPVAAAPAKASLPQPRLGRVAKPQPQPQAPPSQEEQEEEQQEEEDGYVSPPPSSSMRSPEKQKGHATVAAAALSKPLAAAVEKSVAPVNPFLKKPTAAAASASAGDVDHSSGLERLAKFTSPPPAKRMKPSWK